MLPDVPGPDHSAPDRGPRTACTDLRAASQESGDLIGSLNFGAKHVIKTKDGPDAPFAGRGGPTIAA